jgi:hypothetical protein
MLLIKLHTHTHTWLLNTKQDRGIRGATIACGYLCISLASLIHTYVNCEVLFQVLLVFSPSTFGKATWRFVVIPNLPFVFNIPSRKILARTAQNGFFPHPYNS